MARFSGDPGNPYAPGRPDNLNQTGGATFGAPHVLTLFAEVTTRTLKAVMSLDSVYKVYKMATK
jgi:hypothetical protein